MEMQKFSLSQVVWAKIKGYSWWPAMVHKYFKKSNQYSLIFYGNNPFFARLPEDNIKDYEEYYHEYSSKKTSGLKTAIEEANKDAKELNESNINSIDRISKSFISQIKFSTCNYNLPYKEAVNNNELMITSILSNFSLDNNIKDEPNHSIDHIEQDNLSIKDESFLLSKLKDNNEDNADDENDSADEFYFDKMYTNKLEHDEKSNFKDETNEETILKTGISVYDEDTCKLDDIAFMINFILTQIRSNISTTEELINKFKVEILMILKQLIDFKERDSKIIQNVLFLY